MSRARLVPLAEPRARLASEADDISPPGHNPVIDTGPDGLLAHPTVDAFAEEVGMAGVTGVLLDHVHEHFAQTDHAAPV